MVTLQSNFEMKAMKGDPLPKGLDIADSCFYIALRDLYLMYRRGIITREYASEEKKRLIYNWTTDKSKIEFLNRENDALKGRIKEASENYKNSPCHETADKLYAAFYNLPDDWRSKSNILD